jgi:hypothetical protein
MYKQYVEYLKQVNDEGDLSEVSFKCNPSFVYVLEHVNPKQGIEYLKLIESEFPAITYNDIRAFVNVNDKFGGATKSIFTTRSNKMLYCSPSNLRYIYHALIILNAFKESGCRKIVEMGCGYAGLFLAVNMFREKMGVEKGAIEGYNLVDLPEVCSLIDNYLELNKEFVSIPYSTWESTAFGADIPDKDMFFISNYCFSELEPDIRDKYVSSLLPKASHGFMVFQTCFGVPLNAFEGLINKTILKREPERPQTAPEHVPNFFIWF